MRALTLLYHDIVADEPDASGFPGAGPARYKLPVGEFDRHLQALGLARPEGPVTVGELSAARRSPPPLLLTFDDGGVSAVRTAELLDGRGWRGHFLITAKPIGTRAFVSAGNIRDLRRRGHTIGSHSFSHPDPMSGCSDGELREEWGRSRAILEDILGEPVTVASVPGGAYSRAVARAAASVGIRALFTSEPVTMSHRVEGCLVLGRYTLWRGMAAETAAALAAGGSAWRLRQFLSWKALNAAKAIGGRHYYRLRRTLLGGGGEPRS